MDVGGFFVNQEQVHGAAEMRNRNSVEKMDMDMVMLEDNHIDSMKMKNWLNHKKNNLSQLTL